MTDDQNQREKLIELIGKGPARRVRLAVLSLLALSGIVLQGLVWWYGVQTVAEEWSGAEIQVWLLAVAAWILTVTLLLVLLWKRLKGMPELAPK